jgi:hypothetical protein
MSGDSYQPADYFVCRERHSHWAHRRVPAERSNPCSRSFRDRRSESRMFDTFENTLLQNGVIRHFEPTAARHCCSVLRLTVRQQVCLLWSTVSEINLLQMPLNEWIEAADQSSVRLLQSRIVRQCFAADFSADLRGQLRSPYESRRQATY